MKQLKVDIIFASAVQMLGDAEAGRLFKAMFAYASTEETPDLRGNERFVWETIKESIDKQLGISAIRSVAGKRGNDARWHGEESQTIANDRKASQTIANDRKILQESREESREERSKEESKEESKERECVSTSIKSLESNNLYNNNLYQDGESVKDGVSNTPSQRNTSNIFRPPTTEEVREYCRSRNNAVDPEEFVDFYTSKGWLVGKVKMKDWKAAVRTWERSRAETRQKPVLTFQEQARRSGLADLERRMREQEAREREEDARNAQV